MKRSIAEQLEAMQAEKAARIKKWKEAGHKGSKRAALERKMKSDPMSDPNYKERLKQVKEAVRPIADLDKPPGTTGMTAIVPGEERLEMLAEYFLTGKSQHSIEKKWGMSRGYIKHALNRTFADREKLESILYDLNIENAVVSHLVFQKKAESMTARDAAIAAGIFTQRFAEIKRLTQTATAPVLDVNLTLKLEETMDKLKRIHGPVIDITPKKSNEDT